MYRNITTSRFPDKASRTIVKLSDRFVSEGMTEGLMDDIRSKRAYFIDTIENYEQYNPDIVHNARLLLETIKESAPEYPNTPSLERQWRGEKLSPMAEIEPAKDASSVFDTSSWVHSFSRRPSSNKNFQPQYKNTDNGLLDILFLPFKILFGLIMANYYTMFTTIVILTVLVVIFVIYMKTSSDDGK